MPNIPKRDIIVIGASAGGVNALKELVSRLPANFDGSIFIVQHIPPYAKTELPDILSRSGPLPAILAEDGLNTEPGKIYVAPNNLHLLLEEGKTLVKPGPKENRFRPSIDALFRSAAYVYGSRVIGIVLSGLLDDGTSGLWTIKRLRGLAIIQDPKDAEWPQMPENAMEYVKADHVVPVSKIGGLLARLVTKAAPKKKKVPQNELTLMKKEISTAANESAFEQGILEMGEHTSLTCPECHGALTRLKQGKLIRFRCHTGHAYSASSLLSEVTENVEHILWQSVRGFEEMNMLLNTIRDHLKETQHKETVKLLRKKAEDAAKRALIVRDSIAKLNQFNDKMPSIYDR
jgi:two-component system, chemotaxis family, protein-glutamate methylesterase/glutaminase